MKGIFITFEGIEGCGKSTQVELLRDNLASEGMEVILTREPGGTEISERIRELLLDPTYKEMLPETEVLLYAASRSQHTGQKIIPAIESGKVVISDRYYDSTIAYQGAARRIDETSIKFLCEFAAYHHEPDLTFLIDVAVETGLGRINPELADRLEQESMDFHRRVRKGFLDLAEKHPRIIIIDGQKSINEINGLIIEKVKEYIKERSK
ncbi:MAG: dTMP kinase [Candidatus Stygibacter australis]|nr:dTMP kinase [Candidatus Stygibacter australis]MDP8321758.1 dTMP kinase [Candidatus Stygibacter australis]